MYCFAIRHFTRKTPLLNIFSILLLQMCMGSNVNFREYYGTRVPPPVTAIPEADKLIQMSNIRSETECFSICMTFSKCGMIIYSVSDEVCIVRKIKQLPGTSSFIDIPANSIYTVLQACLLRSKWFHVGVCKDVSKNVFVWQNGEALIFSFWKSGSPDNYGGNQKCTALDPRDGHKWNDIDCVTDPGIHVCEIVVL
ncbi:Hypothetical predicted protein [Octopus vulgaris]|uniref:C-type lectin domain-containing protein n=1 Tax=Octopus vulgaris TaxID=6645 RepID=A0AA36AIM1_OCTVU|nr:Hypothetical predicted protein [Octopus vulgaris]